MGEVQGKGKGIRLGGLVDKDANVSGTGAREGCFGAAISDSELELKRVSLAKRGSRRCAVEVLSHFGVVVGLSTQLRATSSHKRRTGCGRRVRVVGVARVGICVCSCTVSHVKGEDSVPSMRWLVRRISLISRVGARKNSVLSTTVRDSDLELKC